MGWAWILGLGEGFGQGFGSDSSDESGDVKEDRNVWSVRMLVCRWPLQFGLVFEPRCRETWQGELDARARRRVRWWRLQRLLQLGLYLDVSEHHQFAVKLRPHIEVSGCYVQPLSRYF